MHFACTPHRTAAPKPPANTGHTTCSIEGMTTDALPATLAAEFCDLVSGVQAYDAGDRTGAEAHWSRLEDSDDPLVQVFARSLRANLGPAAAGGNLYDGDAAPDGARQIDLFEQLDRLGFFRAARGLVQQAHAHAAPPGTTLIDLGMGSGSLTQAIVGACEGRIARVVGVDLDVANVEAAARRFGGRVPFVGIARPMEQLDVAGLRDLAHGGPVCLNAAFALHHLDLVGKRRVLALAAALQPAVCTLVEPHSNHWSADLLTRLVHAFAHFHAVRRAIDATPEIEAVAKSHLLDFFAREVGDIMQDQPKRFERHESWQFWYRALLECGLKPAPFGDVGNTDVELLPGAVNVVAEGAHLLSVFAFRHID